MKKSEKISLAVFCAVMLCAVVYTVLRLTIPRPHDCSIKNSDGYIGWLQIYDGKLYYVHFLSDSNKSILYCYDDENGLRDILHCYEDEIGLHGIDSDENDQIISDLKDAYYKVKTRTNNAGMECMYEDHMKGYVLKEPIAVNPKATYRYVGKGRSAERFPYEDYRLQEYYYGLTDEYIVGIMRALQEEPKEEGKAYIALVDNAGNISVIPDYVVYDTYPKFLLCHDNCVYFWGMGAEERISIGEGEGGILECEGPRLYVYIVDTGEVRKLCDYSNLCRASDLYKTYVPQWSSGDEYEVFIDGRYLYSYSKNGDTDIVRFRLTYDENGYPLQCEYDACIYDNPHLN